MFIREYFKIKKELYSNKSCSKGKLILLRFQVGRYLINNSDSSICLRILLKFYIKIYFKKVYCDLSCDFPLNTKVGDNLTIYHGQGIVINGDAVLGDNVKLHQNVTIGNKATSSGVLLGSPIIGNNVDIGAGAIIVGPITIGDNCIIGAGTVVVKDIPMNSVVVGNPGIIIKRLNR